MDEVAIRPPEPPAKAKKDPARKWLIVGLVGLAIFLGALGFHFISGSGGSADPLPPKVLAQVFGFTPYYFTKDSPPDGFHLQTGSAKFLGNALSFTLTNSKKEKIEVNQKIPPAVSSAAKDPSSESYDAPLGTAIIISNGGHMSTALTTPDKTYITFETSDFLSTGTFKDMLSELTPVQKPTLIGDHQ